MKLYEVTYKTWNIHFSGLDSQRMLAVGNSPEDAIRRAKKHAEKDARDFQASEIAEVMGYKIRIVPPDK